MTSVHCWGFSVRTGSLHRHCAKLGCGDAALLSDLHQISDIRVQIRARIVKTKTKKKQKESYQYLKFANDQELS